jgi:hypothetical protein
MSKRYPAKDESERSMASYTVPMLSHAYSARAQVRVIHQLVKLGLPVDVPGYSLMSPLFSAIAENR